MKLIISKRLKRLLLYLRDSDVMKMSKESFKEKLLELESLKSEERNIELRKDL
jgi:hypothetical protein